MDAKIEQWQEVISQWRESGQTQKDFCRTRDIKLSTLHYWMKRVKKTSTAQAALPGLVRIAPPATSGGFDGNHHRDRPTVSHFGAGWIFLRPPAGCTGGLCMMLDLTGLEIYVRPGITDMRKQVNGLSEIVEQQMNRSAMSGSLFLFCNRDRRLIKCVYWDRNGFCLWLKRLEKDRFPWPNTEEQARQITTGELGMLLDGIDFWHAHTTLQYAECN
jgi:transposase